jgi:hypothetical protein
MLTICLRMAESARVAWREIRYPMTARSRRLRGWSWLRTHLQELGLRAPQGSCMQPGSCENLDASRLGHCSGHGCIAMVTPNDILVAFLTAQNEALNAVRKRRTWQCSKLGAVLMLQPERDIFSDDQGNHHIYNTTQPRRALAITAPPLTYLLYTGSYCSMIVMNGISRTLHDYRRTNKKDVPKPSDLDLNSFRGLLDCCFRAAVAVAVVAAARHQMGSRCRTDWRRIARQGQFALVPCDSAAAYQ